MPSAGTSHRQSSSRCAATSAGSSPTFAHIAYRLDELNNMIDREGGLRKIRPYVTRESQRAHKLVQDV